MPEHPLDRNGAEASNSGVAGDIIATRFGLAIAACIAIGVLIRAFHILSSDFPLNDGGLFFAMTQDLQAADYVLPTNTSYNGGDIPFAYPPFGLYFAGLVDQLTPLSLVDALRFVPLLVTSLTIPAFYLLARSILNTQAAVVASVFAFAAIPRAYIWLLMGGGVTRSFGLLFALLALYQVCRVLKERKSSTVLWASLFCGLTVLSHLETAWFLAFSVAIFFLTWGRSRQALNSCLIIMVGTVVITAPWWGSVLSHHGVEPFLAAFGTGGTFVSGGEATRDAYVGLLRFVSTSEPLFPLLGTLALFGTLACLVTRRFLLPVWWAAVVLLDVRSSATYSTTPIAMLAGIGITEFLLPLLFTPRPIDEPSGQEGRRRGRDRITVPVSGSLVVLAALVLYASSSALLRVSWLGAEGQILEGLSHQERMAIDWASERAPAGSRFLIVPDSIWETAKTAEWFPVLSDHQSVATVQGSEWVSDDGFQRAQAIHEDAFQCGFRTSACLEELADVHDLEFSHVYVRQIGNKPCCFTLVRSLKEDPEYELVYRGSRAVIFRRVLVEEVSGSPAPN